MRYNVCLFSSDSNMMVPEITEEFSSAKKAKAEYANLIVDGFHGETVSAYKLDGKDYPDIVPQVTLKKKTDWRYGADTSAKERNRKKFLKYKFLGKAE